MQYICGFLIYIHTCLVYHTSMIHIHIPFYSFQPPISLSNKRPISLPSLFLISIQSPLPPFLESLCPSSLFLHHSPFSNPSDSNSSPLNSKLWNPKRRLAGGSAAPSPSNSNSNSNSKAWIPFRGRAGAWGVRIRIQTCGGRWIRIRIRISNGGKERFPPPSSGHSNSNSLSNLSLYSNRASRGACNGRYSACYV